MSGTLINLDGINALDITGISSPSVSAGVASFTVSGGGGGVSSFTGDGTVLSNSASTGAVTATLETFAANKFLAGPTSGSAAAPTARAIVATDVPTLNQNTTGTASNLSGTPALPNGTTATTQSTGDTSTNLATDAFVANTFAAPPALGNTTPASVKGTTINATTGYQVSGAATSGNYLRGNGTDFVSSTIQVADVPTLNQNTSGTAANLSGTPALPNGTTATTQSAGDNSTKLATDAFVLANTPVNLVNFNTTTQSQLTVAGTDYYVTNSNISLPAGVSVQQGTTFRWKVAFAKNANGTGAFSVIIYVGTTGTTSDTAKVTQAPTTATTAAADQMIVDVMATVTSIVSTTVTVYWSLCYAHLIGAGAGFVAGTANFSPNGTFTFTQATGLVFGLGFSSASGGTQTTITIPLVEAEVLNLY